MASDTAGCYIWMQLTHSRLESTPRTPEVPTSGVTESRMPTRLGGPGKITQVGTTEL